MCKAVEYSGVPAQLPHSQPVIFLVQEKTGFLSFFYIHQEFYAVFFYLHIRVEGFADKSLEGLHAFIAPYTGLASLINAPDENPVGPKNLF